MERYDCAPAANCRKMVLRSLHEARRPTRWTHPITNLEVAMLNSTPVVFVVDDDVSVRRSCALLIDSAGWRAATFGSAQEFLSCPRVHAPSCLVLDVSLPDLDGLELQSRVTAER